MKITFIVTTFPGLSQTFILDQITGLLDLGHDVEIFAGRIENEDKCHPCVEKYRLMNRVKYVPDRKISQILKAMYLTAVNFHKSPLNFFRLLNINRYRKGDLSVSAFYAYCFLLGKKNDVIHCHFGPNGIIGAQLKKLGIQGRLVTTFHGYDMSRYLKVKGDSVYDSLFADGDLFLPVSEYWKKKLISLGCSEQKIIVHRMGIDTDKFSFVPRTAGKNSRWQLLTIARFVEKKGIKYGIEAVSKVLKKHRELEYKIIGDGPLRKKLEMLVEKLEIADNVRLLGWKHQEEIVELMKRSDILLAPSVTDSNGDQEGIPVVLMEALAQGLPVVSTRHSGIPELIVDGKSGFLVAEKDVDALAEKIGYCMEHPEVMAEMGKYGRKFVEEKFDVNRLNEQLVHIFRNLIKKGND